MIDFIPLAPRFLPTLSAALALSFGTAFNVPSAYACTCAISSSAPASDPSLAVVGRDAPNSGQLRLLLESWTGSHGMGTGSNAADVFESRLTVGAAWTPWNWLTVSAAAPVIYRQLTPVAGERVQALGPGDADLSARIYFYRSDDARHVISALAGLEVPTAPLLRAPNDRALPRVVQPGTGSWDPRVAVSYAFYDPVVSLFTSLGIQWPVGSRDGYVFGRSVFATVAPQVRFHSKLAAVLSIDARWSEPDGLDGSQVADTGGLLIHTSPTLLANPFSGLLLRITVQIPTVRATLGEQWDTPSLLLGVAYTL